jgi:hypothetical protein
MTDSGEEALRRLDSPPRVVSDGLRAALLANPRTLAGAAVFALGIAVGLAALIAAHLPGQVLLARDRREAPGALVRAEDLSFKPNNRPVFRCWYTFKTPDGVEHLGSCFDDSGRYRDQKQRGPFAPGAAPTVRVEYAAGHPEVSRIVGGRLGTLDRVFVSLLTLPVVIGLGVALSGFRRGLRQIRLLKSGEPARAALVSCNDGSRVVPFAEYRDSLREVPGSGPNPAPTPAPNLSPGFVPGSLGCFLQAWTCGAAAITLFGLVLIAVMLVMTLRPGAGPFRLNGRPATRAEMLLIYGVFLAYWLALGAFLIRQGRNTLRRLSGQGQGEGGSRMAACRYKFTPPGGAPVRAWEWIAVGPDLGGGDPPTAVVLYDPDRPTLAALLYGIKPRVAVADTGGWDVAGPSGAEAADEARLRLALAAAGCAAGVALGVVLGRMFAL